MEATIERLPRHLRDYVVEQDYGNYTARDHAAWRFILTHLKGYFSDHAHPVYNQGLEKTGITVDSIPSIAQMDAALREFGWGAVCVRGFIPPLVFLDFGANKILPIAADMRSYPHLAYTPAPDIVHEAAGHAPIIADKGYRDYLTAYSRVARKAIFSRQDIELYEAIRLLSDRKENPACGPDDIKEAEENLKRAEQNIKWVSEAALVSRLFWWTAEYGLIGDLDNPKIFGAGLLSSIGESRDCLGDHVKKIRLSIDCCQQTYDITDPQPQLFVARDFDHLQEVLHELEMTLAFRIGGQVGLERAQLSQAVTTSVFENSCAVSGVLHEIVAGTAEDNAYLRWDGAVQLSQGDSEIEGHGVERHAAGFGMPLGRWQGLAKSPWELTLAEARDFGIEPGRTLSLTYTSGVEVEGRVSGIHALQDKLGIVTLTECRVELEGRTLFDPSWGEYDLLLGGLPSSVYGGPADWERFEAFNMGTASSTPGSSHEWSAEEQECFASYQKVREQRELASDKRDLAVLTDLASWVKSHGDQHWLLGLEVLELLANSQFTNQEAATKLARELKESTLAPESYEKETRKLVALGLSSICV